MGVKTMAALSVPAPTTDLASFNRLVEQHQSLVYTVAYRLLGEAGAATAATTAALTRAYQQSAPRDWPALLWLLRCLLAACGPANTNGGALAGLPADQRQVVALVDVAGLDYDQAGAVLGWSAPQVRTRLAAARQALMLQRLKSPVVD